MAKNEKKTTEEIKEPIAALEVQGTKELAEYDYGDDDGAGYEHQDAADYTIPIINMLQGLSPSVVKRVDPMANAGNMYNTVTGEYYDANVGFLFVPATTRHVFCRWVPRKEGGGFRGQLNPEDPRVAQAVKDSLKFGKYITPDEENPGKNLQLTETFYVYGAIVHEDGGVGGMALLPFTSTKIKPYKLWMTRMRNIKIDRPGKSTIRPPMWANLTRVVAQAERNSEGDFFVFGMKSGDPRGMDKSLLRPDDARFLAAKGVAEIVASGKEKVDYANQEGSGESGESGGMPVGPDGKPLF